MSPLKANVNNSITLHRTTMNKGKGMSTNLRQQCNLLLSGHFDPTPAQTFAQMAEWCETHDVAHDTYGDGDFIESFESKVADLLGYEAAVFVITGTMNQPTALEIACQEKRNPVVAMHESSHLSLIHI